MKMSLTVNSFILCIIHYDNNEQQALGRNVVVPDRLNRSPKSHFRCFCFCRRPKGRLTDCLPRLVPEFAL